MPSGLFRRFGWLTKKDVVAFDAFVESWGVKSDKAVECLTKHRVALRVGMLVPLGVARRRGPESGCASAEVRGRTHSLKIQRKNSGSVHIASGRKRPTPSGHAGF
jgi:hypothetical protein